MKRSSSVLFDEDELESYEDSVKESRIDRKFSLWLHLMHEKTINILKILAHFKLPKIRRFDFFNFEEEYEEFNNFVFNSIQKNFENIYLKNRFGNRCTKYFASLRNAVSKATNSVCTHLVRFSLYEICSIVKAAKRARKLSLNYCMFDTDSECDFGEMSECKLESIEIYRCKPNKLTNCNFYKIKNLLIYIK